MTATESPTSATRRVTFSIDGQELHLVYNFNNLAAAERALGANLMKAMAGAEMNATQFLGLLCGLLAAEQPSLTIDQAAALIKPETMPTLMAAIGEAMSPEPKVSGLDSTLNSSTITSDEMVARVKRAIRQERQEGAAIGARVSRAPRKRVPSNTVYNDGGEACQ